MDKELLQKQIRQRAHRLSQIRPWCPPDQNWRDAEMELCKPQPLRCALTIWRWTGLQEINGFELLTKLSVPLLLALGGWAIAKFNADQQHAVNQSNQKDTVLNSYIKEMTALITDRDKALGKASVYGYSEVARVARMLTLSSLFQLEDEPRPNRRRGIVLLFLHDTGLISSVNERKVHLNGADFSWADLSHTTMGPIDLRNTNFSHASFNSASLKGDLRGINLDGADLRGASLSEAGLGHSSLVNAKISNANLSGAYLSGSILRGADLRGSGLYRADLSHTDLRGVDLRGANLNRASLRSADLSGAMLCSAKLASADLEDIKWDSETRLPKGRAIHSAGNVPLALMKRLVNGYQGC